MKLCGFDVGLDQPLFLIQGPCVVESRQLQFDVAGELKEICATLGIPFIFKSSYDKANRSSGTSFRGPGRAEGLRILAEVKRQVGVPVLTDVHAEAEVPEVAAVVDVLQTPAFLCRQTDFIHAVARAGRPVKKGQFLAPEDMAWSRSSPSRRPRATSQQPIHPDDHPFGSCNPSSSNIRSLAIVADLPSTCSIRATRTSTQRGPGDRERRPARIRSVLARARRWRRALPACSWKRIQTRSRRCPTDRTPGRWARCASCCETLLALNATVKRAGFPETTMMARR